MMKFPPLNLPLFLSQALHPFPFTLSRSLTLVTEIDSPSWCRAVGTAPDIAPWGAPDVRWDVLVAWRVSESWSASGNRPRGSLMASDVVVEGWVRWWKLLGVVKCVCREVVACV